MTDVDAIIAGLSEAERAALLGDCFADGNSLYSGLLNSTDMKLYRKGLIHECDGEAYLFQATPLGLAVRDKLEAENGA